jgi:hypothetical protein
MDKQQEQQKKVSIEPRTRKRNQSSWIYRRDEKEEKKGK